MLGCAYVLTVLKRFARILGMRLPAPRSNWPAPAALPTRDARTPADDGGITAEELRILALLGAGLGLESVAARVAMSPRTLRRRLRGVCERLDVARPIQAIVWAARRGLI